MPEPSSPVPPSTEPSSLGPPFQTGVHWGQSTEVALILLPGICHRLKIRAKEIDKSSIARPCSIITCTQKRTGMHLPAVFLICSQIRTNALNHTYVYIFTKCGRNSSIFKVLILFIIVNISLQIVNSTIKLHFLPYN